MNQRAYTNPFSNTVVLSQFSLGEGLDTTARMQLPLHCAPQILHEVMHHWCFDSPVGITVALLQTRARREAVASLFNGVNDTIRYTIAQDVTRVTSFLEFFRPISEGLALFAEHDLTIGDSEIISRPALLTGLMFAGRQDNPSSYLRIAPLVIESARLTAAHIRRKANLLLQPLSGTSGQYLAGYLFTRLLQRIAIERYEAHADSDFFAHSLRCWMFDDWELVELLLDGDSDYERWIEHLVLYCQERLAAFIRLAEKDLALFTRRGAAGDADLFEYHGTHLHLRFYSHPVVRSATTGKEKLGALLNELFGKEPDHPSMRGMFWSDLDLLALRTTITLGHGRFHGSVTSGGMLQLRADGFPYPLFTTGAPETLPAGWNEDVQVDLILATSPPGVYQLISNQKGIVASQSLGSDSTVPDYAKTLMVDWERRHAKMQVEDEAVAHALANSLEESVMALTIERVRRTRDAVFELKGLSLTPDELVESAQRLLSQDGFLPVLENSPQLVLDAAAISVCAALRVDPAVALPEWRWQQNDLHSTVHHVNECFWNHLRFRPFLLHKNRVLFSII